MPNRGCWRRAIWIALLGCGGFLWPWRTPEAAPAPREVLAFWFGWYGNPHVSGNWAKWQPDASHQAAADTAFAPTDGLYDSHDPVQLERQIAEAVSAGVTGFVADWWGPGTFGDGSLALLLKAAHAHPGFRVSAILDTLEGNGAAGHVSSAVNDLSYLIRNYGSDPAWLKVDSKPVVFIYDHAAAQLSLPLWTSVLAQIRSQTPNGIFAIEPRYDRAWIEAFDGAFTWGAGLNLEERRPDASYAAALEHFQMGTALARSAGKLSCAYVFPGYDDTRLGRPHPKVMSRAAGQLYSALWQAAIAARPDWILIGTWNEWLEGTEIEPAAQYGQLYLNETRQFASQFLAGGGSRR